MFTTHHNEDADRWEAYWNGNLYAITSTREYLDEILNHRRPTMNTTPPVPYWMRREFEDRVRQAVTHTDDVGTVCGTTRDIARNYAWCDTRTIANTLVDVKGVGWGAIYLDWDADHRGKRAA